MTTTYSEISIFTPIFIP
ncbi:LOW QUALITY PROTEIN: cathepsin B-like peptidase (C01 family) [Schistosoma mansoni]|nr:LOW QUALITY PROTEIN: cathepsin B-like peptidase (C01 family) [Schistosoma mansoni]|eukprot:XP_018647484.1 LOW QUALITY PROTEIN: cathepsin B-like peptidase (C01 family) [Schistosoma mansoni]